MLQNYALIEFMRHKQVLINHHSVEYDLGGVALFLFFIQMATGVFLFLLLSAWFYLVPGFY